VNRFSFTTPGTGGGKISFGDGAELHKDCDVEYLLADDEKSLGCITNYFVREKSTIDPYFDKL
jgi:hypothetical protein